MSMYECPKCGGLPGVTVCCSDQANGLVIGAQPAQAGQVLTHRDVLEEWTNTTLEPCTHQEAFVRGARWAEQAVLAKRVPQWLPISTAPKDGTRVMVWMDDKYASNQHAFAKLWFYADGRLGGGAEGYSGDWSISHWMPLPPPPGIVGEKGGA